MTLACFLHRPRVRIFPPLFRLPNDRRLRPAADAKVLPKPEPRTIGVCGIMPSIRSRDIACREWPDIGRLKHFLKLPDFFDDAFNVHLDDSITKFLAGAALCLGLCNAIRL